MSNFYSHNFLQTSGFEVPNGLVLVWLNQSPEFQKTHHLQSNAGIKRLLTWWMADGRHLYPSMKDLLDHQWCKKELFIPDLGIYLGPFLMEWYSRYHGDDPDKYIRANFLLKILAEEFGAIPLSEYVNLLSQVASPCGNLITLDKKTIGANLINIVWFAREDLRQTYDFNSPEDKSEIMNWWLHTGQHDFEILISNINNIFENQILFNKNSLFSKLNITIKTLVSINLLFNININPIEVSSDELASILLRLYTKALEDSSGFYNSNSLFKDLPTASERVDFLKKLVFKSRRDLAELYQNENSKDYKAWWSRYGADSYRLINSLVENSLDIAAHTKDFMFFYVSKYCKIPSSYKFPFTKNLISHEVNLVGIPHSSKGVSEDFRFLESALKGLNYQVNRVAFPEQYAAPLRSSDYEYMPNFLGACNIFVQSPFLTAEFFSKYGYAPFEKHKNYVFWQWEFDSITPKIALLPPVLTEIWTISQFVADGLQPFFSIPVLVAPQTVSVDLTVDDDVSAFIEVEKDAFYFMFAFDGESYFERKNPVAVIRSFKLAFPIESQDKVKLIIKYHNLSGSCDDILKLYADGDSRIILINTELSRSALISLMKKIHCFISLHRAEGFGRLLAEAMLCEKPVIASRYSGNLDFMDDDNSYLVDGDLITVPPGQYQSIDIDSGARWFDANIMHASDTMRRCFDNPNERAAKAKAGLKTILNKYNPTRLIDFLSSKI